MSLDTAIILPFVIPIFLFIKEWDKKFLKYLFRGFLIYAIIVTFIACINYFVNFNNSYFLIESFFRLYFKIIILYPIGRAVVYAINNKGKISNVCISIYSYVVFASVILPYFVGEFFGFHLLGKLDSWEAWEVSRYASFLEEPALIAYLGIVFLLILSKSDNKVVRFSVLLAFVSSAFLSKSLSSIILILWLIAFLLFKRKLIVFDKKLSLLIGVLTVLGTIPIKTNTEKLNHFSYIMERFEKINSSPSGSSKKRLFGSFGVYNCTTKAQKIWGAGLGQIPSFLSAEASCIMKNKHEPDGIHIGLLSLVFSLGPILGILFIIFFLEIRNYFEMGLFISSTMVHGGFVSIPFAVLCFLIARNRPRRLRSFSKHET